MEQQQTKGNLKLGERGAIVSIIAYICLAALKLSVGAISGSAALMADGLNNATDIVASVAVLIGLKVSQKPADSDHPYGHWKAEMIASLFASFIMAIIGIQVLYDAILSVFSGVESSPDMIAAYTALASAVIMFFVYRYNRGISLKINSQAVMAAAKDNLSDALVSIGVAIGIIGSQFGLPWLDPVTALIVGAIIVYTAWEIFRDASHHLTDGFDEEKVETFKQAVLDLSRVEEVKDIKARNYGNNVVVDIVILVNPTLNISEAHHISNEVEDLLMQQYDVYNVHVHVEPNDV